MLPQQRGQDSERHYVAFCADRRRHRALVPTVHRWEVPNHWEAAQSALEQDESDSRGCSPCGPRRP